VLFQQHCPATSAKATSGWTLPSRKSGTPSCLASSTTASASHARYGGAMVRPTLTPFHHAKEKVFDILFQETSRLQKGAPVLSCAGSLCSMLMRGGYYTPFLAHMGRGDGGMPNGCSFNWAKHGNEGTRRNRGTRRRESLLDIVICVLCAYAM
jgi:hypothetical protein